MKKIRYILFTSVILFTSTITLFAQRNSDLKLSIDYHYGFPVGEFKSNIIDQSSPRGISGDLMYPIDPKWQVGAHIGFQDYYQKFGRQTYDLDKNSQVSAVLTNSIQIMPFMAKGMFVPLGRTSSPVQPYISAGVGAAFINFDQYLGEFVTRDNTVQFIAKGGAGLLIPFTRDQAAGVKLGANYNYIPYNRLGYKELNSWDLQGGVYFTFH